jgi:uncharacterized membrane protein YccF (DUF307 family)
MRVLLNLIWLIVAGIELALSYVVAGLLAIVFIVTIPLAVPAFRLAGYALWPFGRLVVQAPEAGAGSGLMNIVWFLIAGWWLFLAHLIVGLLLCITIIGIPFGIAVFKMGSLALAPYGKDVVEARAAPPGQVVHEGPTVSGA